MGVADPGEAIEVAGADGSPGGVVLGRAGHDAANQIAGK